MTHLLYIVDDLIYFYLKSLSFEILIQSIKLRDCYFPRWLICIQWYNYIKSSSNLCCNTALWTYVLWLLLLILFFLSILLLWKLKVINWKGFKLTSAYILYFLVFFKRSWKQYCKFAFLFQNGVIFCFSLNIFPANMCAFTFNYSSCWRVKDCGYRSELNEFSELKLTRVRGTYFGIFPNYWIENNLIIYFIINLLINNIINLS